MRRVGAWLIVVVLMIPVAAVAAPPIGDTLQAWMDQTDEQIAELEARIAALEAASTSTTAPSTTSTSVPSTTTTEATTTTVATTTTTNPTTTTSQATTTTAAGGCDTTVTAPASIQSAVNNQPSGAVICLSGTFNQTVNLKSDQTLRGPAILDGDNTLPHAVGAGSVANNITLQDLTIVNYTEFGVDWGAPGFGREWVIDNCEIAHNYAGIHVKGTGVTIRDSHIHHNTTHGVLGGAGSGGVVLEGNDISYNHAEHRPHTATGGLLLVNASNSVVRNNHIHHNFSHGLHFDGYQTNVLIEDNLVEDNEQSGIFYELGYTATIRGNTVLDNGTDTDGLAGDGAGILVFGSSDVTVENNIVSGNDHGIYGKQDTRTDADGNVWVLRGLLVRNNDVSMSRGVTGVQDTTGGQPALSADNVFADNTYTVSVSNPFRWGADTMGLSAWQVIHPNDG